MGYAGKLAEKLRAQELRRKGLSYKEIRKEIRVSKSTLSHWCRDIVLTPKQLERLYKRKEFGQLKGSVIAAKNKQRARFKEVEKLRKAGVKEVGKLSKRDKFIAGIALYVADGDKYDDCSFGFSNSDPRLIKFMGLWFKEFCEIPGEKFRGSLWIHDDLNEEEAKKYWSKLIEMPLSQFRKSYIVKSKTRSKKIRKKKHPYGVFSLRFSGTRAKRKLFGWIEGIFGPLEKGEGAQYNLVEHNPA